MKIYFIVNIIIFIWHLTHQIFLILIFSINLIKLRMIWFRTFHCRAWVSAAGTSPEISQRIKAILHDILQQVLPKDSMDLDADTINLEASLKEYLSDKRCVYVSVCISSLPLQLPNDFIIIFYHSTFILSSLFLLLGIWLSLMASKWMSGEP